jgi:hypothetical protein
MNNPKKGLQQSPSPPSSAAPIQNKLSRAWAAIKRVPADRWVSISSVIIALSALFFSVNQAREQRRFQKLTVRPLMTVGFVYNKDGAGFMFGDTGIGYAMLKSFEVLVDGQPQTDWMEMCRALGFAAPPTYTF